MAASTRGSLATSVRATHADTASSSTAGVDHQVLSAHRMAVVAVRFLNVYANLWTARGAQRLLIQALTLICACATALPALFGYVRVLRREFVALAAMGYRVVPGSPVLLSMVLAMAPRTQAFKVVRMVRFLFGGEQLKRSLVVDVEALPALATTSGTMSVLFLDDGEPVFQPPAPTRRQFPSLPERRGVTPLEQSSEMCEARARAEAHLAVELFAVPKHPRFHLKSRAAKLADQSDGLNCHAWQYNTSRAMVVA